MPTCCVVGCNAASSGKDKELYPNASFHVFPKDKFTVWEEKVKRLGWSATKHSVICSRHFEEDCYEEDKYHKYIGRGPGKKAIRLKPGAIPTLLLDGKEAPQKPPRTNTVNRIKRKENKQVCVIFIFDVIHIVDLV